MIALIVGMLVCIGLAVAVLGLVAIPARREGRDLLTPHGEQVLAKVREKTETAVEGTISRTGDLVSSAKDRRDRPGESEAATEHARRSDPPSAQRAS